MSLQLIVNDQEAPDFLESEVVVSPARKHGCLIPALLHLRSVLLEMAKVNHSIECIMKLELFQYSDGHMEYVYHHDHVWIPYYNQIDVDVSFQELYQPVMRMPGAPAGYRTMGKWKDHVIHLAFKASHMPTHVEDLGIIREHVKDRVALSLEHLWNGQNAKLLAQIQHMRQKYPNMEYHNSWEDIRRHQRDRFNRTIERVMHPYASLKTLKKP